MYGAKRIPENYFTFLSIFGQKLTILSLFAQVFWSKLLKFGQNMPNLGSKDVAGLINEKSKKKFYHPKNSCRGVRYPHCAMAWKTNFKKKLWFTKKLARTIHTKKRFWKYIKSSNSFTSFHCILKTMQSFELDCEKCRANQKCSIYYLAWSPLESRHVPAEALVQKPYITHLRSRNRKSWKDFYIKFTSWKMMSCHKLYNIHEVTLR